MAATATEDNEIVHLEEENNTELPIQVDAPGNSVEVDDDDPRNPKRIRKFTSTVWKEFSIVKLANGTNMVECIHCKTQLKKAKAGTTTQYKRHLQGCFKRQVDLKGQQTIVIGAQASGSSSLSSVQNWKYDHAKIREGDQSMRDTF
ncbi:putative Zinc finger, BED-type [Corchorus olitorius]|uniref:Zinc finger, BED-type n=1 Tax=Corchorus olitorius TaxID=93759 RepID=A0A1R3GDM9_9ROSI|nr:putative Zinc finger, BED-type [Corchorus olitorius]